jgi:hypothetical protein
MNVDLGEVPARRRPWQGKGQGRVMARYAVLESTRPIPFEVQIACPTAVLNSNRQAASLTAQPQLDLSQELLLKKHGFHKAFL